MVEATFTNAMGSIPLDVSEKHIPKITLDRSYNLTSLQLKLWSGHKKNCTTKPTITESNNESLTAIAVKEHDFKNPPKCTVLIREVTNVPHCQRFLKCYRCFKKISQTGTPKVAHCTKCGMIRSNNCLEALLTTNEVVNDRGKETILKITSDTLNELLG